MATELCTNAIEATPPDVPVEVRVSNDGTALRLTVANHRPVDSVEVEPAVLQPGITAGTRPWPGHRAFAGGHVS